MQITLEHLTKRFGDTIAVNDLCVTLESGKLTALLGPSRLRKIHRTEHDIRHSAGVCGPRFV